MVPSDLRVHRENALLAAEIEKSEAFVGLRWERATADSQQKHPRWIVVKPLVD